MMTILKHASAIATGVVEGGGGGCRVPPSAGLEQGVDFPPHRRSKLSIYLWQQIRTRFTSFALVSSRRRQYSQLLASMVLVLAAASTAPVAAQSTSLVGTYDGGQMEIAAGLELRADHRFRYALSYGALDEQAAGTWAVSGNQVLLTSDPVVASRFVLVSHGRGADGILQVSLDVPKGVSRQYFDALITSTNGDTQRKQLGEQGLSASFTSANVPISLRMLLPVFSVVGEPVKLDPNSGYSVRFRFEPNDLGKVAFHGTPLRIENGDLLLDRHDRTIRFKRSRQ